MPAYTYRCPECAQELEVSHPMSESPELYCPECQSLMERAITSAPAGIVKGKGYKIPIKKTGM